MEHENLDTETAKKIWNWTKTLISLRELSDFSEQKIQLSIYCGSTNLPSDFSTDKYCFPSKITEKFANEYIKFFLQGSNEFKFITLLREINNKHKYINVDNINALLIMLIDVALYRVFTIIKKLSHGRFLYQLNMCVVLDTMIIKPDRNIGFDIDIVSMLTEVNEKAILRIDNLVDEVIWKLAMLNYKVHLYEFSITFFDRYRAKNEKSIDKKILSRVIHSKIYIGYCYEKSEDFDSAINLFEATLLDLTQKENDNKLIRELNHGLGHFYNERAIFGHADDHDQSQDILKARHHMVNAFTDKVDYTSCYGSLFYEYGDYQTAQNIFNEANVNKEIITNKELSSELQFYIAQTDTSEKAQDHFKEFEDYCKKTFNYDGIVHARIFKVRAFLRKIAFSNTQQKNREKIINRIHEWNKELTQYSLSSYASKSIKTEYKKILCILNIFMSLYADKIFEWHTEDLQYNIRNFMEFMPKNVLSLGYTPEQSSHEESNLYQVALGNLWVWCVGSELLEDQQFRSCLLHFGSDSKIMPVPNNDFDIAHNRIKGNGKPDLVILIPPAKKECGFEQEFKTIKNRLAEYNFVYCANTAGNYNSQWFEKNIASQGKRYTCYSAHSILDALVHAYCLRSFEILKKELLKPIPLFSLAPTHFSASYDFQLGEQLEICFDSINEKNKDSRTLSDSLSFIDKKYSKNWLNRFVPKSDEFSNTNICTCGVMNVCCPAPLTFTDADNYMGYYVKNLSDMPKLQTPHGIKEGQYYTIKALPSYNEIFWDLEKALRIEGTPCEQNNDDTCTVFKGETLSSDNTPGDIAELCREILSVIFNKDIEKCLEIDMPFECILKKVEDTDIHRECFIYIILLKKSDHTEWGQDHDCPFREKSEMVKNHPTVFVTYSWDKPKNSSDTNEYLKEVTELVKTLRNNGYDATFDLEMYKKTHNWTSIMTEGLKKDKVIVLLTKEYKQKADDLSKRSGVAFEAKALVDRFNRDPENIILAKLPSQCNVSCNDVLPICFSGENVIDLASDDISDGYNQLLLTLNNRSVPGELPPVSSKINKGRTF